MARLGRPTKLTGKVQRAVCEQLELGNYLETAAAMAGITSATIRNWVRRGTDALKRFEAEGDLPAADMAFAEFAQAVAQAQAKGEARHLSVLDEAASLGNWKAAAWMLERKAPERWGRREQIDVEMDIGEIRKNILEVLGVRDLTDLDEND